MVDLRYVLNVTELQKGTFMNNTSRMGDLTCHHYHPAVCLTTGSKPLPKRSLHILRSTVSSFKFEYPLLSLRTSSSLLRIFPSLLITSICPFIFPSITCSRRQLLRGQSRLPSVFLLHVGYSSAH